MSTPTRWMIQVIYHCGQSAYLRHGSEVGVGKIVQFSRRKDADINVDLIAPGLESVQSINVVPYNASCE